ncbi:MAG: hypothetical protein MI755_04210 [Sphingomonadales bacterium]|nr:hypothetical protein [Sphingomonadales bacterium]
MTQKARVAGPAPEVASLPSNRRYRRAQRTRTRLLGGYRLAHHGGFWIL